MPEITWNKNIEPQNKAEIERYLTPLLWLVPKWCQSLHINLFDNSPNNSAIETIPDYEYRYIQIDFFTSWLNSSPETKQDNVIHELLHGFVNILYYQARRAVLAFGDENEAMQKYVLSELSKTVESVTQDLSYAIVQKFK